MIHLMWTVIAGGALLDKPPTCTNGVVAHSNVTAETVPCTGEQSDRCPFKCDDGYLAIGMYMARTSTTSPDPSLRAEADIPTGRTLPFRVH